MEEPQRWKEPARDINDLLQNGFYKTARGRSPSTSTPTNTNAPAFLNAYDHNESRYRSRSRGPRKSPPKPICEDEIDSLAKEFTSINISDDEPPMRGIIEQYPVILEADVTVDERERLHMEPRNEDDNDNEERRFVFVPRSESASPGPDNDAEKVRKAKLERRRSQRPETVENEGYRDRSQSERPQPEKPRKPVEERLPHPPIERKRSRQDLPALNTKPNQELPPQFRRTTSAYVKVSPTQEGMPRVTRTNSEYMLSPEMNSPRVSKGSSDPTQIPSRQSTQGFADGMSARPIGINGERNNGGSNFPGPQTTIPRSDKEKRGSGNFEAAARSRQNTDEQTTRPQHPSEEYGARKPARTTSTNYERPRSPRSSGRHRRHDHSSSEDDLSDSSDSDRKRHRHRGKNNLRPEDESHRHRRVPSASRGAAHEGKTRSRYASPLPSPKISPRTSQGDSIERSDTPLQTRDDRMSGIPAPSFLKTEEVPRPSDRLNPMASATRARSRSRSRQPSSASRTQPSQPSVPVVSSRVDIQASGDPRRSAVLPQYEEQQLPNVRVPEAKSYWQPPPFQPPSSSALEKPVGSYRRYSEDIERGSVAPLPTCSRTNYVRGRNDWLTLPRCPGFDICPDCYRSTMLPTQFHSHFIPAPIRPPEVGVICDFGSSPWYRIAWLLTLKEGRRDLKLFYRLAEASVKAQPCLGRHEAIRNWYSILDPKTGMPIKKFDVCYSCVKSVEAVLPAIRGIFVRIATGTPTVGICDLRFDSKRFVQYFDALETAADTTNEDIAQPDIRELVSLAKKFSQMEECQRDMDLTDRRWHTITQLPEFTVCEECYDTIVYPHTRKAIPAMFTFSQRIPRASCQLYSERMRSIFKKAVDADDYKYLASRARERKGVELEYKANVAELKRRKDLDPGFVGRELTRLAEEWRRWE